MANCGAATGFADLQSFLDLYFANLPVLRTEADFCDLASAYLARAAGAGVRRAEIFFDPQTHMANGVPLAAMFAGLSAALANGVARHDVAADLILCFLRDLGAGAAEETLAAAMPFREDFIGVGLDSVEVGHPPSLFRDVFERAAAERLRLVAHVGEEGGPEYVWEALDELAAERIDHGIRAMEDPRLVVTAAPLNTPDTYGEYATRCLIYRRLITVDNCAECLCDGGWLPWVMVAVDRQHGSWRAGRPSRLTHRPSGYRRCPPGSLNSPAWRRIDGAANFRAAAHQQEASDSWSATYPEPARSPSSALPSISSGIRRSCIFSAWSGPRRKSRCSSARRQPSQSP